MHNPDIRVDPVPRPSNETDSVPISKIAESCILFGLAFFGIVGNFAVLNIILCCRKFRHSATAFLWHQCLLDMTKALYCIPYGYSLLTGQETLQCNLVGTSYVLLMTASAYNLFALVINEEYQLLHVKHNEQNYCCIAFGVFMIWFASILLNLGVAFLPGNPQYNSDIGSCVFTYGIPGNVVLHILWMTLVTLALVLASAGLVFLYRKIHDRFQGHKWIFVHQAITNDVDSSDSSSEMLYDTDEIEVQNRSFLSKLHRRRVLILVSMIVAFFLCWYPLFFLTIIDSQYQKPSGIYKVLTILAWSHPVSTPIFCSIVLQDIACSNTLTRDLLDRIIPLKITQSNEVSRATEQMDWNTQGTSICNQNSNQPSTTTQLKIPTVAISENSDVIVHSASSYLDNSSPSSCTMSCGTASKENPWFL